MLPRTSSPSYSNGVEILCHPESENGDRKAAAISYSHSLGHIRLDLVGRIQIIAVVVVIAAAIGLKLFVF